MVSTTTTRTAGSMDYGHAFREVASAARGSNAGPKTTQARTGAVDYGKAFEQVAQSARQGKADSGTAR